MTRGLTVASLLLYLVSASALLASCTSPIVPAASSPVPPTWAPSSTAPAVTVLPADENAQMLQRIADDYGLDPAPPVAVAKSAAPQEREDLIQRCMAEHGFVVDSQDDFTSPASQNRAFGSATYTCWARYPLDVKYWSRPPTDEQRTKLYRYWVEVRTPCLQALSYVIPEPPTLESWLGGEEWAPHYYAVPKDAGAAREMEERCPSTPPDHFG